MDRPALTSHVKQLAYRAGFDAVGIAPTVLNNDEPARLADWLALHYHGSLNYLARKPEARYDARSLLPDCRSVIVTALSYNQPSQRTRAETSPRIARYAQGDDYHDIVLEKLLQLAAELAAGIAPGLNWKATIDTSPLAEKAFAAAAGIGWRGKHSLILNRTLGSWFVIGMLLTSLELEADAPLDSSCGECTHCIDACPTGALAAPAMLDVRACISYRTTAHKAAPAPDLLEGWLYGCDICQQACPFNRHAKASREPRFAARPAVAKLTWQQLSAATAESWRQAHAGTELGRRNLDWLKAAIPVKISGTTQE